MHLIRHAEHRDLRANVCHFLSGFFFLPFSKKSFILWYQPIPAPPGEVHFLHGDPMAPGQVPSELHPAIRDIPSSILASKPHRTASPFQCDVLAKNNQLVFWRNYQKRAFWCFFIVWI